VARLAAIGIVTRNIAESCRFYRTLGLDVPEPLGAEDHFDVELPGGVRLMWDTEALMRRLDPEREDPRGQRMALAFACADADDVDATFGRLVEAGFTAKKEPWDAFWGQRYAEVFDPDGNGVDLFAPL
jgi:uncharacterized glyoxalase superfamily protein PhnB